MLQNSRKAALWNHEEVWHGKELFLSHFHMSSTQDNKTKTQSSQRTYRFSDCHIPIHFVICLYNGVKYFQDQNLYLTLSTPLCPYRIQKGRVFPKCSQTSKVAWVDALNPNILGRKQRNPSQWATRFTERCFLVKADTYIYTFLQQEHF